MLPTAGEYHSENKREQQYGNRSSVEKPRADIPMMEPSRKKDRQRNNAREHEETNQGSQKEGGKMIPPSVLRIVFHHVSSLRRKVLLSLLRAETIYTFDGRYGTGEKEEGQAAK